MEMPIAPVASHTQQLCCRRDGDPDIAKPHTHINSLDKCITPSLQCQLTRDGKFLLGHCAVPFVPVIVACCDIELDRSICLIGGRLAVEYEEITAFCASSSILMASLACIRT